MSQQSLFDDPLDWVKANDATVWHLHGRWHASKVVYLQPYLSRFVLQQAKTLEEAIRLVEAEAARVIAEHQAGKEQE